MIIKCKTDKGKVREGNEDYILTFKGYNYYLLIAADGMGGYNAGEVASKMAALEIRDFIYNKFNDYFGQEDLLNDAIKDSNKKVYEESQKNSDYKGMGTTITCALIVNDNLYIGHVGDSRAYVINNKGISQITEDHSYVQQLINNGSITKNEAINHPQRNLITRAVGTDKNIVVDTFEVKFKDDEMLLLCTDGLTTYLNNDEIYDILNKYKENGIDILIDTANERGGTDNISAIVARKGDK